jgi:hypothetical protein
MERRTKPVPVEYPISTSRNAVILTPTLAEESLYFLDSPDKEMKNYRDSSSQIALLRMTTSDTHPNLRESEAL